MKAEEANKIIAEYIDCDSLKITNYDSLSENQHKKYRPYAYSLDALVPVWEKLRALQVNVQWAITSHTVFLNTLHGEWQRGDSLNVHEASAVATAKAIRELREKG
jgi:hypothetical protein